MSKLYPPEIGGTIPAFYNNEDSAVEYIDLTVPFIMNKTVSQVDVSGFALIVKSVANSKLLKTLQTYDRTDWDFKKSEVTFKLNKNDAFVKSLFKGSYYKLQLAYIGSDGMIGYYSSIGIIKYTAKPSEISIENLSSTDINKSSNSFVGVYSQLNQDVTEKVYSYQFNIYDADFNLFITSGELLHNSFEDEERYSSRDVFKLNKDLPDKQVHYIEYQVKTINNAIFKTPKYKLINSTTVDPEIKATLEATLNYDNGYVDVHLVGLLDEKGAEYATTGQFIVKRGCSKDNYAEWNTLVTFRLNGTHPSRWLWRDFTIEHGYEYRYSLQQFNDYGMYSNKIYSEPVKGAFEDMFLFDGEKQFKMRFNPKITSFKDTILTQKTNTIGNKYPFTFSNKAVCYKEFPINGLVSYFSDEEELFISNKEILLSDKTSNLTDDNLTSERLFKLKVLEFFNDGKPKLFKSPAEGNYIVKLMNTSMTPTDQLSRMLHSITATAYEMADFNYENLLDLGFIKIRDFSDDYISRAEVIELGSDHIYQNENLLQYAPAYDLLFENVLPGTLIEIIESDYDVQTVTIGITGQYRVNIPEGVNSVRLISNPPYQGALTYSYKTNTINTFDKITEIEFQDYPMVQFIGANDIVDRIEDIRTELMNVHYLRFTKRLVQDIYVKIEEDGETHTYYEDMGLTRPISSNDYFNQILYQVKHTIIKQENNNTIENNILYYLDGSPDKKISTNDYMNKIYINDAEIDITKTEVYELIAPENIEKLTTTIGIIAECGYSVKLYQYNAEPNSFNITLPAGRMRGDVDGDGRITSDDKDMITQWSANTITLTDIQQKCADINLDGKGDSVDDLLISYVVEGSNGYTPASLGNEILGSWKTIDFNDKKYFYKDISIKNMTSSDRVILTLKSKIPNEPNLLTECLDDKLRIYADVCPIIPVECVVSYKTTAWDNYQNALKNYTDLLFFENISNDEYIDEGTGCFTSKYRTALEDAYKVLYPDKRPSLYQVYLNALEAAILSQGGE